VRNFSVSDYSPFPSIRFHTRPVGRARSRICVPKWKTCARSHHRLEWILFWFKQIFLRKPCLPTPHPPDSFARRIYQRPNNQTKVDLDIAEGDVLQILVENQGRICYGPYINDTKGLVTNVTVAVCGYGEYALRQWWDGYFCKKAFKNGKSTGKSTLLIWRK
jgi:hypothetical protein